MNGSTQKHFAEQAHLCTVCGVPLKDDATTVKKEYLGTVLTFCSDEHWKEFFEDPERYGLEEEVLE